MDYVHIGTKSRFGRSLKFSKYSFNKTKRIFAVLSSGKFRASKDWTKCFCINPLIDPSVSLKIKWQQLQTMYYVIILHESNESKFSSDVHSQKQYSSDWL